MTHIKLSGEDLREPWRYFDEHIYLKLEYNFRTQSEWNMFSDWMTATHGLEYEESRSADGVFVYTFEVVDERKAQTFLLRV